MAERDAGRRLLAETLGTFHAAALVALLVLLSHLGGSLPGLLGGAGSVTGTLLFGLLWLTTWWTARRALTEYTRGGKGGRESRGGNGGRESRGDDGSDSSSAWGGLLVNGFLWGGVNGTLFYLALMAAFLATAVVTADSRTSLLALGLDGVVGLLAFYGFVAALVAFIIGAVIGFLFACLDLVALGAAGRLARRALAETRT